jgi:hypothetical protein
MELTGSPGRDLASRCRYLTNVAADKHYWIARFARIVGMLAAELGR